VPRALGGTEGGELKNIQHLRHKKKTVSSDYDLRLAEGSKGTSKGNYNDLWSQRASHTRLVGG
jgi:hypothetical protein